MLGILKSCKETNLRECFRRVERLLHSTSATQVCINIGDVKSKYQKNEKLVMTTAYDYTSASLAQQADIDLVLVGDSLSQVMLGRSNTTEATMDEMILHCSSVSRTLASKGPLIVGDMPFGSYVTPIHAAENAIRLVKEGGVTAVKLEGGTSNPAAIEQTRAIVSTGIPVMGHLGLTPQTAVMASGYKVQGKVSSAAELLIADALKLQDAGCFSVVLEMIPAPLAEEVTNHLDIPTIGIGAGPSCSGQVLVFHDLIGLFDKFKPKFVKRYANVREVAEKALRDYAQEVRDGQFPAKEHSFGMKENQSSNMNPYETQKRSYSSAASTAYQNVMVIGGGAMSSLFCCLHCNEFPTPITMITRWQEQLETVSKLGLTLHDPTSKSSTTFKHVIPINADDENAIDAHVNEIGSPDLILLATKAFKTQEATTVIKRIQGPDILLLSLQNGAGNIESLMNHLGTDVKVNSDVSN